VTGPDTTTFLQGLVSNDVNRADGSAAAYSALLTPQGKYLFDFFLIRDGENLYLQTRKDDIAELTKRLSMFKLRSKVELADVSSDFGVFAFFDGDAAAGLDLGGGQRKTAAGSILYMDPRLAEAGAWGLIADGEDIAALGGEPASAEDYRRHRIGLGLPEAPDDLIKDKSILLESGFDELAGVDWKKGCYMGQELTARTKYRGLVKKRLVPVALSGTAAAGSDVMADGKVVGDLRSVVGDSGIAMLRLDAIRAGAPLQAGDATATPTVPGWMQLPEPADAE
jgi:hypothetical protein